MLGMAGVVGTGLGGLRIYRILETTKIGKVGLKFRTKGFVSIVTFGFSQKNECFLSYLVVQVNLPIHLF